jgi:hypothetical protein
MYTSLKEEYTENVLKHILIDKEDLTETESKIIEYSFDIIKERLEDIKLLNNEVVRLKIQLANLKSYLTDI